MRGNDGFRAFLDSLFCGNDGSGALLNRLSCRIDPDIYHLIKELGNDKNAKLLPNFHNGKI